ncbi:hypothetical protein HMPREF0321_2895 [Dermacoccus sp. Ellin185]|nr:hypothetical protein HMPREF0321_2895 [Dermacoccus sp. Ellin185]
MNLLLRFVRLAGADHGDLLEEQRREHVQHALLTPSTVRARVAPGNDSTRDTPERFPVMTRHHGLITNIHVRVDGEFHPCATAQR